MDSPTVYQSAPYEFTYLESDSVTLPLGKEYKLKMVNMNGIDIAAFNVDGEDLLCFPQVYEYFLKDLVSGMHTVYTKLKRMNIQGRNCNVEQVRMMRSVGAIGQVVNRCKLISREDFNKIYEDCLLYRGPGRRRKNPEIPPELLNNPFKIFKADTSADQQTSPSQVTGEGAKCASDAEENGEGKDEQRDSNNNRNGDVPTAFKVPVSQRTVPTMAHPRMVGSPNGSFTFSPRTCTSSLSSLPTMVNIRSAIPQQLPSRPTISTIIQPTQSPARAIAQEGGLPEQSVPHVSSTGTVEHADNRGAGISDGSSDVSASSPRIQPREVEYPREPGSVETLLHNIQGLLKVTAETARQQQRQAQQEIDELRRILQREREAREKAEKLIASLQRSKAFWHKKFKREKKGKKRINEKLTEEQQRSFMLEQQLQNSSQESMKQMNDSLIKELDKERMAKGEAERKLQEARGEIQNFMQNFLENPRLIQTQQKHNGTEEQLEVKEEHVGAN